ncbi:MAG: hypothetical protein FD130_1846 [Halothiobacillaceae bacterium]|nr:MAG: hypothetical protein FD130_1846 [Halothiobacillaceae bacterium]
MGKVEKIEHEIETLSPNELGEFRRWFRGFDASHWDRQIEEDAQAGKLDGLAEEALKAFTSGKASKL